VREAWRSLARSPLLVAGAIATLAVSAGLNVAVFGLIHRALLGAPTHVTDTARVFTLGFGVPGSDPGATMTSTSYVAFDAIRKETGAASRSAAFQRSTTTFLWDGEQRNAVSMLVSGGYFDLLGVRPLLGRGLGVADDEAGAVMPAAVLSHAFWRAALGGDPGVVGRRVHIGGLEYEVAGVMPEGFSGHSTSNVDVFVPFAGAMRATPGWDRETMRNVAGVLVRLAPDQNAQAAATRLGALLERPVFLRTLAGSEVGANERKVATWLAAVAALVLIIGLANSAILLVVRGVRARKVTAIRAALGASAARLRSQAFLDAALLAGIATLLSTVLASAMEGALRSVLFPELQSVSGTGRAGFITAIFAGLASLAVAAAASVSQLPRGDAAFSPGAAAWGSPRKRRSMTALLVLQTSLAVLLLGGAGLFGASLHRLRTQDFGLALDSATVVEFEQTSAELEGQDRLFTEALGKLEALPGVELATPINAIPFAGFNVPPISVPGRAEAPGAGRQLPFLTAATPKLLTILGIQVLEGRPFTDADDKGAPVVLVNQTMARTVWPGESAIGKCIRVGFDPDFDPSTFDPSSGPPMPSEALPCREVIGVVKDVRQRSVLPFDGEDRLMQYLVPFSQVPIPPFVHDPTRIRGLLLRVDRTRADLPAAIRRTVLAGRTDLPYLRVRTYAELLDRQLRPWTMGTRLLAIFSGLALAVAALGIFAAFAHTVAERRREMAIRIAIGARPGAVRRMVLREALKVALGGVLLGGAASVSAGRAMQSLLFGTAPTDPLVLLGSGMLMLLLAATATFLPAREAARADPSVVLRTE
jgi:putative ABC transport system permease protein